MKVEEQYPRQTMPLQLNITPDCNLAGIAISGAMCSRATMPF